MREALRQVEDPEIGMNIVDLGLVYDVRVVNKGIKVVMTFTSMGCPEGPAIIKNVRRVLGKLIPKRSVSVELVWEPAWNRDMMSEEAKARIRMLHI